MSEIITRAEARARGLTRYFTGQPCVKGHVAERYANFGNPKSGPCVDCHRAHLRKGKGSDKLKIKKEALYKLLFGTKRKVPQKIIKRSKERKREYWRVYQMLNRERLREYRRVRKAKVKSVYKAFRELQHQQEQANVNASE